MVALIEMKSETCFTGQWKAIVDCEKMIALVVHSVRIKSASADYNLLCVIYMFEIDVIWVLERGVV